MSASSRLIQARAAECLLPRLVSSLHKGSCGKVGVIGGCAEYTGAPYYAAMSALRTGADLAHVFCTPSAASAIKSYSPELIVHGVLAETRDAIDASVERIEAWFPSLTALVIGCGLGRDEHVLTTTRRVIQRARRANLPLVLDGDALYLVATDAAERGGLKGGYARAVLTPNVAEQRRLMAALKVDAARDIGRALGGVGAVLLKGACDEVWTTTEDDDAAYRIGDDDEAPPCRRRCGGQGDLLAGSLGAFASWACADGGDASERLPLAAAAASLLVRRAASLGFADAHRSTTALDVLAHLGKANQQLWPVE